MQDLKPRVEIASTTVLVVDADSTARQEYAEHLRSLGCIVRSASSELEAYEKLRSVSVDVIVTDLGLAGASSREFLRTVREHDLDVPVVVTTGSPELQQAVDAVEYGAFSYLTKPVTADALRNVVRRAVHMRQLAKLKREALELVGAEHMGLGDRAALENRFESALSQIWIAYQPIVREPGHAVFGYEALVRSNDPMMATPASLFDAARRLERVDELGRTIRECVSAQIPKAPAKATLFINVVASDLNDPELLSPTTPLAKYADRVVLEITERASLDNVKGLSSRVTRLRDLGYKLAIDDLGAGYAGLTSLTRLEPDFVKLDRSLVHGVSASERKQSVIRAMIQLCSREFGIRVIAEGVELETDRDVLALEGCDLMQGYLFARPKNEFATPPW